MKYKAQIIGVCLLLLFGGALFGAWQFYFKAIFDGYKEDARLCDSLEKTILQLQDNFHGYQPELLIEQWQNQMQPWKESREERARYFNFGDMYELEVIPPEGRMLKFWYTEETNKMLADFYAKVYERMGAYNRFPGDLRAKFGVAKEEDWSARNVTWAEVERNLRELSFGIKFSTMLLESNASSVQDIVVWPRRIPESYDNMLGLQTVGLHLSFAAKDLVRFLEKLSQESRYFTVDGIKLSYPYIGYNVEPQIDVLCLVTQANYRRPQDEPDLTALDTDMPAPAMETGRDSRRQAPEGILGSFWRWFRRVILYRPS
ncbi:MAG: hypothetical protein GX117_14290 [Candidatus Hydrogenedentes bacterium]|nr:hypothetical protein [Candidatus Hydrogenedentota bacterium]